MSMQIDDLGRQFMLDVDAVGNVFIREKGKRTKGGPMGLPVFSTDTLAEAEALRVRHCKLARDGSGLYTLNDPPLCAEDLGRVSDLFRGTYGHA